MSEISDLVEISKYAGERFDMVQAGSGNSSVKLENGRMIIKASGYSLSEISEVSGYSTVITKQIADILKNPDILSTSSKKKRENLTSELVKKATIDNTNRPSIETLLHSCLLKYTLHTHPIIVNIIVSRSEWRNILQSIFPEKKIFLVEYKTPGIELALILDHQLKKLSSIPNIIFLQNHGLIITSDCKEEIYTLTEYILDTSEVFLKIDLTNYKITTLLSKALNSIENKQTISYLSEDLFLNTKLKEHKDLFFKPPFCPDSMVYCGIGAVEIKILTDLGTIYSYRKQYNSTPTIIIFQDHLFIISQSVRKAKEIEDVLKFNILVLSHNTSDVNFLNSSELAYLSNWEAEQFRQNL